VDFPFSAFVFDRALAMRAQHIPSIGSYLAVFAALNAFLGLTVLGHYLHWGILAALLIALCKAVLVALYFMHLRYSSRVVQVAACIGLFWLAIMITLTLSDYTTRDLLEAAGK
jgi:cytochrome c oxidase subunit 4